MALVTFLLHQHWTGLMRTLAFLIGLVACGFVPKGNTIAARFDPPPGFVHGSAAKGSFGTWLRELPLKPEGAQVHLYNGALKADQHVQAAVIDISVGDRDLQQCADAVMRLRAEYLFASGRQDAIAFDLTNGFRAEWKRWRTGERIRVSGNTCTWTKTGKADSSHEELLRYLTQVFTYAGTLSLSKELTTAKDDVRIGDVFIQGGSPGHAVIVVDVAQDADGRRAFLLAQSYMPAQEIHVLRNARHPEHGAWFVANEDEQLFTPEWTFGWNDRKRW